LQLEDGELAQLDVEYEWLPPLRHKCSSFDHVDAHCPTKADWVAKESYAADMEKNLEEDQTHDTSQLGNSSAQDHMTTSAYMLEGRACKAGYKPPNGVVLCPSIFYIRSGWSKRLGREVPCLLQLVLKMVTKRVRWRM